MKFLLLPLHRYLFSLVSDNKYQPRVRKENALSITNTGNVTVSREVVLVVTIPFSGF